MNVVPISRDRANEFIKSHHRHHKAVQGFKFAIALEDEGQTVGVAVVGRPVSRHLDDGLTAEVTRLCTDGTRNACSMLLGACSRAAKAMGYKRIQTYILDSENGSSLKAAGWSFVTDTSGGDWNSPSRAGRRTDQPQGPKQRWELRLAA